jgi:hypothetical protein
MRTLIFVFFLFVKCINCQILNSCYNCPKNISYFEATDIMNEETYSYLNLLDYINSDDNLNFNKKRKIKKSQENKLKSKEKKKLVKYIINEFENYFEDSSIFFDV